MTRRLSFFSAILPGVAEVRLESGAHVGAFVLDREIGRGGSAVVWAAWWRGREIALKIPHEDLDGRDKKRFQEEADLLARVAHDGVIEVLDSGTLPDGRPYLAMPLLAGEALSVRLERGKLGLKPALRLFSQLANAVVHLHEEGLVHRDIKPENVVYIEDEEKLVLLDFGIARELDRPPSTTTQANVVRGTPATMAPERFFGARATASSDVYELAVVLYAMVTGRMPWEDGTDPQARLFPKRPSEFGIELPNQLVDAIFEALSTRAESRPTARELLTKVRSALDAASQQVSLPERTTQDLPPIEPAPVSKAGSIKPPAVSDQSSGTTPAKSNRWLAVGVGALAVVGAVVGAGLGIRSAFFRPTAIEQAHDGLFNRALDDSKRLDITPTASASANPENTAPPDASASAAPNPQGAGITAQSAAAALGPPRFCERLAELYCTPEARKMPGGEDRCKARRAEVVHMKDLPASTQARGQASCRDAIPALERSLKTPQPSEAPEDAPFCKRVVAEYCAPAVKNSIGGDALCAGGKQGFGNLDSLSPADRAKKNEDCARMLPAVIASMKQHIQDFAPGSPAAKLYAPPPAPQGNGAKGGQCGNTVCGSAASCCSCRGQPICFSLAPGATCASICP
jgi:serine/threonine-protein kinase